MSPVPQWLKPACLSAGYGTAEAVDDAVEEQRFSAAIRSSPIWGFSPEARAESTTGPEGPQHWPRGTRP